MTVVVVEDEQRSREGLCRLLSGISDKVTVIGKASNGSTGLDLILEQRPDVVFTDIRMPVMDGLALMEAVRSHGLRTEFIVISGYAEFEFARKALQLDAVDYLIKPVTSEEIERVLHRAEQRLNGIRHPAGEEKHLKDRYPEAHPAVSRALDIIETSYAGKISQRDLAAELELSPEYFSYLFSKNTGETFSDMLRNFRIEKARELYQQRKMPTKEVPYAVGFSDGKYFKQVFKNVTGQSPTEYLQSLR